MGTQLGTRFWDSSEARGVYRSALDRLETAAEQHYLGTEVVITTAPHRDQADGQRKYDGVSDMYSSETPDGNDQGLIRAKKAVIDWLEYHLNLNSAPNNTGFIEFTKSGIPHMHLLVYGIPPDVIPQKELRKFLDLETKQNHCQVVHFSRIETVRGEWRYENGAPIVAYLLKSIRGLLDVADDRVHPGHEAFDTRDGARCEPWKIGLFWAIEARFVIGTSPNQMRPSGATEDPAESILSFNPDLITCRSLMGPGRRSTASVEKLAQQNEETFWTRLRWQILLFFVFTIMVLRQIMKRR
ncbi:hypothetical protein ACFQE1_03050 [Halobium palmae]|uniref:Uncharacterized protein n=1 Tax=Halobium palmae TaxID=1776492 RepID=A0ABD5RW59_9EURY